MNSTIGDTANIENASELKAMIIFIGIQGSGKTSYYKHYLADRYVHINLDTLHTRNKEKLLLEECISAGKNFVVDNTNPTRKDRERYIPLAKSAGYTVVGYYFASALQECISQNNLRHGKAKLPAAAIAATSNKLELPSYDEGFDKLFYVKRIEPIYKSGTFSHMIKEEWRDKP